jgi:arylsulfatase A-like enzyme
MIDIYSIWNVLIVLCLIAAAGGLRGATAGTIDRAAADRPPNVVLILADDLGYGDLACYGAKDIKTPHIDALVAAGMRFDRFYANCPVCSPTRASILTGRYPDLVGVPGVIRTDPSDNWGKLTRSAVLLPAVLKKKGYESAIIGKWHLGLKSPDTPLDRGFDVFQGFLGDMMDDYFTHRRHNINYMRDRDREIDPEGHATDLFTQWAVSYVREKRASDRPFFMYLAYNAPHVPLQPVEARLKRLLEREPGIDPKRARLAAQIEHLDEGVGNVIAALKETGAYQNTLVIFTSDNGGQASAGASTGGLRGSKENVYEGGIRVPCCVEWPGKIASGSRTDRSALSMDLFPTVCAIVGIEPGGEVDGESLLPTLLGQSPAESKRDLFWTRREGNDAYMGKTIWAIRRGEWKLLQNTPTAPFELYNLRDDPLERNNLASKERAVYRELAKALRDRIRRGGAVPWQ